MRVLRTVISFSLADLLALIAKASRYARLMGGHSLFYRIVTFE